MEGSFVVRNPRKVAMGGVGGVSRTIPIEQKIHIKVEQRNNLLNDLILGNGFLIKVNYHLRLGFEQYLQPYLGKNIITIKDSKLECLTV